MSIYSSMKLLRLEKQSGIIDLPYQLIHDLSKPVTGLMGHQARMALQETRLKMLGSKYKNVYAMIARNDPILQDYEDKASLQEAYKVMIKFAPNLALEPLVARSFLRMYVQGDGVIPEQQIQRLAEAEGKFTGGR